MGRSLRRLSSWAVGHPVWWAGGFGVAIVVLGVVLDLAPIVIVATAAVVTALNVLHARRRGYCPLPEEPDARLIPPEDG